MNDNHNSGIKVNKTLGELKQYIISIIEGNNIDNINLSSELEKEYNINNKKDLIYIIKSKIINDVRILYYDIKDKLIYTIIFRDSNILAFSIDIDKTDMLI
jgi:hypothetical protein